ncbi:MAG TPA: SDR family NAD(P)-dependent oxidoreductase [Actinomycetota bacterium]|nr:SDR family NAD(P)-dependent oxidoreductase [Actinomycetota bacterium]
MPGVSSSWEGVAGRHVVLTGGTHGIGLAAGKALAGRGAQLTIVARDPSRGAQAAKEIKAAAAEAGVEGPVVDVAVADLLSQASVLALAAELAERPGRIDVLINNAGAVFAQRRLTDDGVETTWALNHLAPFLLTNLLLERLKRQPPARIITTTSDAHKRERLPFADLLAERRYKGFRRYGQTKLANICFTAELARRLAGSGVTATCFNPGLVATGFNHNNGPLAALEMRMIKPFSRTPEQGAETLVWLADAPEAADGSGKYFFDCKPVAPNAEAQDPAIWKRLWEVSERQTGLAAPPAPAF